TYAGGGVGVLATTTGGGGGSGVRGSGALVITGDAGPTVSKDRLPHTLGTMKSKVVPLALTTNCQASNGWRPVHRTLRKTTGLPARFIAIQLMCVPGLIVTSVTSDTPCYALLYRVTSCPNRAASRSGLAVSLRLQVVRRYHSPFRRRRSSC